MILSPLGIFLVASSLVASPVYFTLTSSLPARRRIFASIHGLTALSILPLAMLFETFLPGFGDTIGLAGIIVVGAVASASALFATSSLPGRQWFIHLLLIPVLVTIAYSCVLALFLFGGH